MHGLPTSLQLKVLQVIEASLAHSLGTDTDWHCFVLMTKAYSLQASFMGTGVEAYGLSLFN